MPRKERPDCSRVKPWMVRKTKGKALKLTGKGVGKGVQHGMHTQWKGGADGREFRVGLKRPEGRRVSGGKKETR